VAAGDTIAAIRDKINAQTGTTNVQASILSTKADGSDQRLVLSGLKTGAANAFAIGDDAGGTLVAVLGFDGTNTVEAGDSAFTLDGGATSITRPTNVVADSIPGVTLTLNAKGDSTVTVDRQASAGASAMQSFVDAYNRVQSFARTQSAAGAALQNDPILRSVRGTLAGMTLTSAPLIDGGGQPTGIAADMTSLGALGIAVQKDGTLSFDQATFNRAYPSRMNDVRAVLADRMAAFHAQADGITKASTGQIDEREKAMETQNATLQTRIDQLENRLEKKRTVLLAQYAKFEASLGRLKSVGESMSAQFSGLLNSNKDS
jgi:flagellar hook-associated protein 2